MNEVSKEDVRAAFAAARVFASTDPDPEVVAAILLITHLGPKLDRIAKELQVGLP